MTEYLFAKSLPREARVAAATAEYGWIHIRRRTEDGCCPLGVALRAAGFADAPAFPDSRCVAILVQGSDAWTPFRRSVSRFICDWDAGDLREDGLPAALGVSRFGANDGGGE